jgi:propanediol dehydratase small subunit
MVRPVAENVGSETTVPVAESSGPGNMLSCKITSYPVAVSYPVHVKTGSADVREDIAKLVGVWQCSSKLVGADQLLGGISGHILRI